MNKGMEASSPTGMNQPETAPPPAYMQTNAAPPPNPGDAQPQHWSQLSAVPAIAAQPMTAVYVTQPMYQNAPPVPDEMVFSILTTIFCCFYLGIPAIILSSQANSLRYTDPQRAYSKAKIARALNITSVVLGSIAVIVAIAIFVLQVNNLGRNYHG